jgi:hypothetical protein
MESFWFLSITPSFSRIVVPILLTVAHAEIKRVARRIAVIVPLFIFHLRILRACPA